MTDRTRTQGATTESDGSLDQYLHTAFYAASEAVRIQLAERGSDLEVTTKSSAVDLVTRVDKLCEERIREIIRAAHPAHAILGEEEGESGGTGAGASHRWIVDPIDGTVNYAHGYPYYSTSIALEIDGQVQLGVVKDGNQNETFSAVRGRGARLNGRPISVTSTSALGEALVCTGFSYDLTVRLENLELLSRVLTKVQGVRRGGSAALDVCYVAAGRLDAFWEYDLNAWDTAAATLILAEAGGSTSGPSGQPYRLGERLLVATNGHVHGKLLDALGIADLRA